MKKYNIVADRTNKKIFVTTKTEKQLRAEIKNFEILQVCYNKKNSKQVAQQFATNYKYELQFDFFIPSVKHVPFHLRSEKGKQAIIDANKKRLGEKRSPLAGARISKSNKGKKKNFSPEYIQQLKHRRTREYFKYIWIYEPYSGKTKQLRQGLQIPEGWKRGRPEISTWLKHEQDRFRNRKRSSETLDNVSRFLHKQQQRIAQR